MVALEGNTDDGRVLDDRYEYGVAVVRNLYILEQPGGIEVFQRRIERGCIELAVRRGVKIRADGIGTDMPVAGHRDRGILRPRRGRISACSGQKKYRQDCRKNGG